VALAVGTLAAQTPSSQSPSPQNPTPQTPSTQSPSAQAPSTTDKPISATGCVRQGADGKFYLTNASEGASSAVGTTGSAPSTPSASSASEKSYRLQASMGVDLSKHVGHKIQVTGTEDKAMSSAGTSGSSATEAWAKNAKDLKVTLVKMIAESCQ
jgi:hypothetical protein